MDELYRRMLDLTRDGVYRYMVEDGRVLEANHGFVEILELDVPPQELVDRPIRELVVYTEGEGSVRRALQAQQEIHGFEYHFRTLKGTDKCVLHDSRLGTDPATGKPVVEAIIKDITRLKQAEAALRASEERFREIFENAMVGLYRTTPDGRILLANPALIRMLNCKDFDDLARVNLEGEDAQTFYNRKEFRRHVERDGKVIGLESVWTRSDGTPLHVRESARTVRDTEGNILYYEGTVEDITERMRAAAELERRTRELEERNAELDSFVYTVSHDLKSPLVAITGFADLVLRKCGDEISDDCKRYLGKVTSNVVRMKNHIDDLLELSRVGRETAEKSVVPLRAVVAEALKTLGHTIAGRGIQVHIPDDLPQVRYHALRIRQVIMNLIENAVKFMGDQSDPHIDITWQADDAFVRITVTDNGIGIPQDSLRRIFEVFLRLPGSAAVPGTGIGLALVQRIVERHGGRAWAESTPGAGSQFHFTIPNENLVKKEDGDVRRPAASVRPVG